LKRRWERVKTYYEGRPKGNGTREAVKGGRVISTLGENLVQCVKSGFFLKSEKGGQRGRSASTKTGFGVRRGGARGSSGINGENENPLEEMQKLTSLGRHRKCGGKGCSCYKREKPGL